MLVPPESSSAVHVAISSMSASIRNHFNAKLVDSIVEIAHFQRVPKFDGLVRKTP